MCCIIENLIYRSTFYDLSDHYSISGTAVLNK